MGRELQKKKNRSGIQKIRQKPKSKKRIVHHPIIAQNWDQSQSLAQNYKRLGLTAKLNKNTGGVERKARDLEEQTARDDPLSIVATSRKGGVGEIQLEEAQIERDAETGAILRVIESGTKGRENVLGDLLNELDDDEDEEEEEEQQRSGLNQHASNLRAAAARLGTQEAKTAVVKALENEANRPVVKYKHKQSEGERVFVQELVEKYGDDYAKMARDIKINYMQRSEGDIKRRVKRWRESGGTV